MTLFCNATGSSLTISWTKDGYLISTSADSKISFSNDREQFTITNVNRTDSGDYRCVASNRVGNDTSSAATVSVECKYSEVLADCSYMDCV